MPPRAATVAAYLAQLPPDRRRDVEAVRRVVLANLPPGYEEVVSFGMLGYVVPLARYPDTYNKQPLMLAALASQKQYMSIYLMSVYGDPALEAWFTAAYRASGKRLDMGKSCVRFARLEDLPLDLVGEVIGKVGVDEYIARYEAIRARTKTGARAAKPAPAKATKAAPAKATKAAPAKATKAAPAKATKAAKQAAPARPKPTARRAATSARGRSR
jgi:hypothetical protein